MPSREVTIPISVKPVPVDDSVPMEDKIKEAAKHLRTNRSGGASGIRDEHLKGWIAASKRKKQEAAEEREGKTDDKEGGPTDPHWERLVDLIQTACREGGLAEESMWHAVVLIPKGKRDYRRIGLVEVMWKVVAAILDRRLTASIAYHDFLHIFQAGRSTGTATLKAKLLHNLASLREEVLYVIFLDLHKAYEALDRSWCLEILEGYGVGPRACWLLRTYWGRQTIVARVGGTMGKLLRDIGA